MNIPANKTQIMGVINITPDSFFDGGKWHNNLDRALAHAEQLIAEGADYLDIGGESSRPGATPVPEAEELDRVIPLIKKIKTISNLPLSIDTYKPAVARAALIAGATIINDITGLINPGMCAVAAEFSAPVIIMHMRGKPQTMQQNPVYIDVVSDILKFFEHQIKRAAEAGISEIILDPGIGFGKSVEHNLTIIKRFAEFKQLGYPLLSGPSRKSFIGAISDLPPENRLEGTLAAVVVSSLNGANIVRVHDVKAAKRALQISDAIKNS